MSKKTSSTKKFWSVLTAVMIGTAGIFTTSLDAQADGYPVPDPDQATSLTLHKHVKDAASTNNNPVGAALAGVGFKAVQIGAVQDDNSCKAISLSTPAGWQQVKAALAALATATDKTVPPKGYCAVGSELTGTTDTDGSLTWKNLRGLFLVVETSPGTNLIATPAEPFMVAVPMPVKESNTWDYTVDAYPKNVLSDKPVIEKTVGATNVDGALTPGAKVPWTITLTIPAAAFPYTSITVTDTPSGGQADPKIGAVTFNGVALVADGDTPDYTVVEASNKAELTLTEAGLTKINAVTTGIGAKPADLVMEVTTTVVAEGIVPGILTNKPSADLNGKTTTSDNKPESIWGMIQVTKKDAESGNKLSGAEFVVYDAKADGTCDKYTSATTALATGSTDTSGVFKTVLWVANRNAEDTSVVSHSYCLAETKAPAGYILDPTPRPFKLTSALTNVTLTMDFPNTKPDGPGLPLTGAAGTLGMTLGGLAVIGFGCVGAYLARRTKLSMA